VRNSPPSSPRAEIPPEIAQEIAVANVGGGTIVEFGIDYENGRQVYEIEIVYEGNKYEMDIDAITGEITEYSAQIRSSHDYGHHDD
jgi:uncharacterized membrane protein YkoI